MIAVNARYKTHAGVKLTGLPDESVGDGLMGAPVVVLAGGTGGAKLARGMLDVCGDDLVVIANTADDIEIYGAYVSPDPDLVTFWLADRIDERGWGLRGDTFAVMDALRELGAEVWFSLGDRDLAIGIQRAARLAGGARLTETLAELGAALGVEARVLPMSDDPVRTWVRANAEWQPFQEFMIRAGAEGRVQDTQLRGVEDALPTPEVLEAAAAARAIIIGPSNPVISIGPILDGSGDAPGPARQPRPDRRGLPDRRRQGAQGPDRGVHALGGPRCEHRGDRAVLRRADRRPRRGRAGRRAARAADRHAHERRREPPAPRRRDAGVRRGPRSMNPKPKQPLTYAILPVKRFAVAKARLGDDLSSGTRRALAESMVTDVLMALRRTTAVDEVVIVTSEPAAEAIGHGYGATVLADHDEEGQSAATLIGIEHALERGAGRVLLVPGDCPALDPAQLDRAARAAGDRPLA